MRWSVEVIDRQAAKMALLLDDLLDVSRITRGRLDLHPRHVDAAEVINSAIETVSPLMDERRQDLRVELPPDPIWLNADPLRLSQVIANLLTNAARYSEPGSKIRVVASRQGSGAQLSVSDEGIGITNWMSCSRCSDKVLQALTVGKAGWALAWRWPAGSWSCMAARWRPAARVVEQFVEQFLHAPAAAFQPAHGSLALLTGRQFHEQVRRRQHRLQRTAQVVLQDSEKQVAPAFEVR